jgi:UDP-N-acetylglucosamine 2-epimerase (non-hydrolysing)
VKNPIRIVYVVGARPNFMKIAPVLKAMAPHAHRFEHRLVHTGQHYDERMSEAFFSDLAMPRPDINLEVGSGTHAEQTGKVMMAIEPVLRDFMPDWVVVVGDVNSTLACALTAKKLNLRVAHIEAGLRSFDRTMPEEINRLATDAIADLLFTTDRLANENLEREGVAPERIHFVGNVMIDTLLAHLGAAQACGAQGKYGLESRPYATLTLHRPSNVDSASSLAGLLEAIVEATPNLPIIFPVHPRTRQRIETFGLERLLTDTPGQSGIFLVDPLPYLEFLDLNRTAHLIITDSGGLQEEATILGVPCITLRENTERPITVSEGTNVLAGISPRAVRDAIASTLARPPRKARAPEKWDGKAAERIVNILLETP